MKEKKRKGISEVNLQEDKCIYDERDQSPCCHLVLHCYKGK